MSDCKCGCGEEAAKGKDFRPGHDSKLRTKIEGKVGGILNLERLIDNAEDFSQGKIKEEEFINITKEIFDTKNK
jgi:hypothetical protein